jgi:hypothetical protein
MNSTEATSGATASLTLIEREYVYEGVDEVEIKILKLTVPPNLPTLRTNRNGRQRSFPMLP